MTATEVIRTLGLAPLPVEGGYFLQTWRSEDMLERAALPPRYPGPRSYGTAIYYLLTCEPECFSALHSLATDEVYHFYLGDPVEMLLLHPDGHSVLLTLGQDLAAGQRPQILVPAGVWQGERLVEGGKLALFGCTVTPGFDFADYMSGSYAELSEKWPAVAERIRELTRI